MWERLTIEEKQKSTMLQNRISEVILQNLVDLNDCLFDSDQDCNVELADGAWVVEIAGGRKFAVTLREVK